MMKYLSQDFVATEYFNVPFHTVFRYCQTWCYKVDYSKYREFDINNPNTTATGCTFSIAPSAIVAVKLRSLPYDLLKNLTS